MAYTREKLDAHDLNRKAYMPMQVRAMKGIVAGVIDYHAQQRPTAPVRILVVGGGSGSFSRELLPEVQRLLEERRLKSPADATPMPSIEVVESDISNFIGEAKKSTAKSTVRIARASGHALPFRRAAFDIVLAESSLNFASPEGMGKWIAEIHRVLSPRGTLINNQYTIPNAWTQPGEHSMIAMTNMVPTEKALRMQNQIYANVVHRFHHQLQAESKRAGFTVINSTAEANGFLDRNRPNNPYAKYAQNVHEINPHGIEHDYDPNVPSGKDKVTWRGRITLATKSSNKELFAFLKDGRYVKA